MILEFVVLKPLRSLDREGTVTLAKGTKIFGTLKKRAPGARFSKVPKTFRARKAICEIANRLFWRAGLLTCFQGNKKKNNCEV